MKKLILIFSIALFSNIQAQTWKTEDQYIQRFAQYAVEEMELYNIPASITLAQGLLETGGGQSRLAQEGKNHFGIKCKENWTGKTMKHTDDAPNECFRVYEDPRESYRDHSLFLVNRPFYKNLFQLDPKDYNAWAHGLKKAGYATNPRYAYILIDKIEKYKLYEFDNTTKDQVYYAVLKMYPGLNNDVAFMAQMDQNKANSKVTPPTVKTTYEQTSYAQYQKDANKQSETLSAPALLKNILVKNHPNGGMKFFVVPVDTDVATISNKFGISEKKLIKFNELNSNALKKNDIIFLDKKSSSGNVDTYKTEIGEDMHDIAQKFGIKLSKLYSKNRMDEGQQPRVGQIIYLKNKKPRS